MLRGRAGRGWRGMLGGCGAGGCCAVGLVGDCGGWWVARVDGGCCGVGWPADGAQSGRPAVAGRWCAVGAACARRVSCGWRRCASSVGLRGLRRRGKVGRAVLTDGGRRDGGFAMTGAEDRPDVVVIGGGLAGISAALELAEAGRAVTLVEGRSWLGGATCSFLRRGLTIDNGQHLFLRSCTAYRNLLARLGATDSCVVQDRLDLTVLAPGGGGGRAQVRLRRSALPSPMHLAGALARYRLLSVTERARVAAAVMTLRFADVGAGNDRSLAGWLADHGQHEKARAMLWDWLCAAALNTVPEQADLSLAATLIRTTVLAGQDDADIGVPSVPFSQLHSAPAAALLGRLGATIRMSTRAAAVEPDPAGGYQVTVVA